MRRSGWMATALAALAVACGGSGGGAGDAGELGVSFPDARVDAPSDVPAAGDPAADARPDEATPDDPGAIDPGPADVSPPDPGPTDPGPGDPGAADVVAPGSKGPGRYCTDAAECADGANCVSGEYTSAHCNPPCASNADCNAVVAGANGQCAAVGGASFDICIWFCGMMGGTCPGDMVCDGAACR